jgi:peptidoglycan/xylan/chitin deacetylase (PgdA/CDA1 family)
LAARTNSDQTSGSVILQRTLKHWAEQVLASAVARSLGRRRRRGQRLILAYHNVVPHSPAGGERSLHLDFDDFRRQLDTCMSTARVTAVEEALAPVTEPAIAITFDDAYEGAVTHALPEIAARGLPATMFVSPDLLDRGTPWWDRVAGSDGTIPEIERQRWLEQFGGETAAILSANGGSPGSDDPVRRISRLHQLREAARFPGLTLGAHTLTHPNLCRMDDARLAQEIAGSLEWVRREFPAQARPWLAYPYGRFDRRVQAATHHAGCTAAFAITGGWFGAGYSPLAIPRLNVPAGLSPEGFVARLNGLIHF